ncbi:MAG: sulfotransferase [Gemmatimonadetes bacterium]|nr:sulfotransferase [Gemmatimonadota bacterium]
MPGARPDPRAGALPGQELVYGGIQGLWSAAAKLRFRRDFDRVAAFCLFVGYPRSGHSLVGAMLNAHPDAVIAHELDVLERVEAGEARDALYARLLARAAWFNLRGNQSNYRYQIPGQAQGRFRSLRVVGDKGGGWAAQRLAKNPELLDRLRDTVRVPLRLVHVVRNPFDNVAAIALWHSMPLSEATDFFFAHCETTARLHAELSPDEMMTVPHEDFFEDAEGALARLCGFLGLEADPAYLAACAGIVFRRPTLTRTRVSWTEADVASVRDRAAEYEFFGGYRFEADAAEDEGDPRVEAAGREAAMPEGLLHRVAAFVAPKVR